MNNRVKLRVQGLTNSQIQSGAYALILAEDTGIRRIPIIVGTAEAQSIAIALEEIKTPRPLTHDLFASFSRSYDITLKEVFIYKFEDGVFYSELLFDNGEREVRLDSRTSDAIAIALRVGCDIYTMESIIQECGVVIEDILDIDDDENDEEDESDTFLVNMEPDDLKSDAELEKWLSLLDKKELLNRLEEAVGREKYEHAKMYRDELRKREEGGEEFNIIL